ncbi:MAG: DsbA family oxidoreductase [Acidimicrobiales bacterium]
MPSAGLVILVHYGDGVHIDIWSDVVCPWCYLGKRRLERAMGELEWADEITIRWRAFQLDPTATSEPKDLAASIDKKYGPGAFASMSQRLGALGEAEGIDYRFDRAVRVGTLDAHRVSAWAWATGGAAAQGPLEERMFRAYFTEGANVADADVLAGLAADCGLDRVAAREVAAGDAFAGEVAADLEGAHERQITGVPGIVVADRFLIPGAQEPETLVAVLNRARERFTAST